MDKRLEKALEFSNFRIILSTRQENLKILMENKLKLHYGGGIFRADRELLSFLGLLLLNENNNIILVDLNDNPILIEDLKDFTKKASSQYDKALKQYYDSYQKLSEMKDIRKVVNWDEPFEKE